MAPENIERLNNLITQLQSLETNDDGKIRFDFYGGGSSECYIRGNESGLLKTGIEFLKAAIAEYENVSANDVPQRLKDVSLDALQHEDSDIQFSWINRTNDLTGDSLSSITAKSMKKKDRYFSAIAILLGLVIFFLYIFSQP